MDAVQLALDLHASVTREGTMLFLLLLLLLLLLPFLGGKNGHIEGGNGKQHLLTQQTYSLELFDTVLNLRL